MKRDLDSWVDAMAIIADGAEARRQYRQHVGLVGGPTCVVLFVDDPEVNLPQRSIGMTGQTRDVLLVFERARRMPSGDLETMTAVEIARVLGVHTKHIVASLVSLCDWHACLERVAGKVTRYAITRQGLETISRIRGREHGAQPL